MSENVKTGNTYWMRYTRKEIAKAWDDYGQGHQQAVARLKYCVVAPCSFAQALTISALFIRQFAIPTCCHYDGQTISLYCGDAGSGAMDLMIRARMIVELITGGDKGDLFAEH